MLVYRERFIEGAMERGVERAVAERVFEQVRGFSGFGFPKAHAAAFGLLAYQSTWLRVHYGPEFLCALLNEQPMGFYPPDALVHEAQRRGMTVLPPARQPQRCRVPGRGAERSPCGSGSATSRECRRTRSKALVAERERTVPTPTPAISPRARALARDTLERLAWAGACDDAWRAARGAVADGRRDARPRGAGRRAAVAAARAAGGARAAGAHRVGAAGGRLRLLQDQHRRAPDGAAAAGPAAARDVEPRAGAHSGRQPRDVAGLVVARQRPATAKGVTFMLLEDELGRST